MTRLASDETVVDEGARAVGIILYARAK